MGDRPDEQEIADKRVGPKRIMGLLYSPYFALGAIYNDEVCQKQPVILIVDIIVFNTTINWMPFGLPLKLQK